MSLLVTLSATLEARDPHMCGHAARVAGLAEQHARRLGWRGRVLRGLRLGAALHDVGKIELDRELLAKPGPLTADEVAQIRRHPAAGARIIDGDRKLRPALPYVLYHHERWDGTGYPEGRAGTEIPVEARLLAIADAFDAMTSARPYRPSLGVAAALSELERCSGTQFDPHLAESFTAMWRRRPAAVPAAVAAV